MDPSTPADEIARPWPLARVALIVFACWFVLSFPWLSGLVTIPWDAKAHFYPQLQFLARSWHEGLSPFWTPYVFSGSPQIADPQSLIFSPPYALLAALNPSPDFRWSDGALLGMLLIAALAVVVIFRDRGWHPAGAVVAALACAFGASAAWRIQHVGQVLSLSYFVVALMLVARALERGSIVYGFLSGVVAGFMVLGRDQVALLGVYVLAGLVMAGILMSRRPIAALRGAFPPLAAGALGAILVATMPILLTAFLAAESNRPVIDFVEAGKGSLHPAALLTAFVADLYGVTRPLVDYWGPPSPAWEARFGPANLFLARNMSELYLGLVPVIGIVSVGLLRGAAFRREARALAAAALLLLLFALGRYTPAFRVLFELPGIDLYRRPADALFLAGAMLALLGGYLVHVLLTDERLDARPWHRLVEAAFVVALVAASLWLAWTVGRLGLALRPVLTALLCLVLACGALVAARGLARKGSGLAAAIVLAATMTLDLSVNNGPNESTALPPSQYDVLRPDTRDETIALLKRETLRTEAPDRRDRIELAGLGFAWPNASLVHDLDNTLGYNPLRLGLYSRATGAGDHVALPDQRSFSPLMPGYRSLLADMLGLRFIATGVPVEQIDKSLKPGDLVQIARTPTAYVYENPRALPRVLVVPAARQAAFEPLLETGRWPDGFDPNREVLLERAPSPSAAPPASPPGTARILGYGTTAVTVETQSPAPGWLVLNDVWQPWWRVEVDGRPAELLHANVIFRAVAIPAGRARVTFSFRPFEGLWAGIGERLRPARR